MTRYVCHPEERRILPLYHQDSSLTLGRTNRKQRTGYDASNPPILCHREPLLRGDLSFSCLPSSWHINRCHPEERRILPLYHQDSSLALGRTNRKQRPGYASNPPILCHREPLLRGDLSFSCLPSNRHINRCHPEERRILPLYHQDSSLLLRRTNGAQNDKPRTESSTQIRIKFCF